MSTFTETESCLFPSTFAQSNRGSRWWRKMALPKQKQSKNLEVLFVWFEEPKEQKKQTNASHCLVKQIFFLLSMNMNVRKETQIFLYYLLIMLSFSVCCEIGHEWYYEIQSFWQRRLLSPESDTWQLDFTRRKILDYHVRQMESVFKFCVICIFFINLQTKNIRIYALQFLFFSFLFSC